MFSPENEFKTFDNFELIFVIINAKEIIHVKVPIFFLGGGSGVAGSEDFTCATLPTTLLDFQGKI